MAQASGLRVAGIAALGLVLIWTSFATSVPGPAHAAGTSYYVDCAVGDDASPGTAPDQAWRTLERANQVELAPGDDLLLKRGCTWTGPLRARWHGTETSPIHIGAFGSGPPPKIAHADTHNVKITGSYLIIQDIQTEHTEGDYTESYEGNPYGWKLGFNFQDGAHHNTVRRVRTAGHAIGVNLSNDTHDNRVLESVLADNFGLFSRSTAATGVLLHGDANEIAYNRFQNNQAITLPEKSISVEVYDSTRGNIHHNFSTDRIFAELGSGRRESSDNVFAYNVHTSNYQPSSPDGKGALFLVTRGPGCNFGPVWRTTVFNNAVYLTGENSEGVVAGCSSADVLTLQNNILVAKSKALYVGGSAIESNNVFWPTGGLPTPNNFVQGTEPSNTSMIADPQFVDPGAHDFHLQSSSPAIDAATDASVNAGYTKDMDGETVPAGGAVDAGADEVAAGHLAGTPTLPGRVEAEDYTAGGEGVAYHDTTAGNAGGAYRSDDVDLEATSDAASPGYNVGWMEPGEWLAYDVNVASAGTYRFTARVASPFSDKRFHLEVDGTAVTGPITVPNTGGWQAWTDVTTEAITLAEGHHTVKLVAETDNFNVNYIDVAEETAAMTTLPGRVEAEDYNAGGEGVAYHDTTAGNIGGAYRDDDVDIQTATDAGTTGYNVGWLKAGEWLAYDVNVASNGSYTFTVRVASSYSNRSFHLEVDGTAVTGPITVPNTGGWQAWTDVTTEAITLEEGRHTVTLVAGAHDFNVNYIDVVEAGQ